MVMLEEKRIKIQQNVRNERVKKQLLTMNADSLRDMADFIELRRRFLP